MQVHDNIVFRALGGLVAAALGIMVALWIGIVRPLLALFAVVAAVFIAASAIKWVCTHMPCPYVIGFLVVTVTVIVARNASK